MGGGEREDTRGRKRRVRKSREQRKKKGEGKKWEINKGWARGGGRKRGRGRGRGGEEEWRRRGRGGEEEGMGGGWEEDGRRRRSGKGWGEGFRHYFGEYTCNHYTKYNAMHFDRVSLQLHAHVVVSAKIWSVRSK